MAEMAFWRRWRFGYNRRMTAAIVKQAEEDIVDFLRRLFATRGAESYLGEEVTMAEHMLQAAHFAAQAGAGDELIVAALLHDVGHFTGAFGDDYIERQTDNLHEDAGAAALAAYFPDAVINPIKMHVAAKRYLCATDPAYFARLSEASVRTLELQGGAMNDEECRAFERRPGWRDALQVRRWDDDGKVAGMEVAGFEHYVGAINRVRKK